MGNENIAATTVTKASIYSRFTGHQGVMIGAFIVIAIVLVALFAPVLAPHDPYHQNLLTRLIPPVWDDRGSWEHVLGTDHLGEGLFLAINLWSRISLLIGFGAALISGLIGPLWV